MTELPRPTRLCRSTPAGALIALLLAATAACAQSPPAAGTAAATLGAAERDSVIARAERARSKGADSARVTIYEVSDYQCPFCARFAAETGPALDSAYVRTGKAKIVFINLPIPSHREAWAAAEGALCAGAQGKYWPMHDLLFQKQQEWSAGGLNTPKLLEYGRSLGLDAEALRRCLDSDAVAPILVSDIMQTAGAGIGGTPTFILSAGGQQRAVQGAQPFAAFQKEIDALLGGK